MSEQYLAASLIKNIFHNDQLKGILDLRKQVKAAHKSRGLPLPQEWSTVLSGVPVTIQAYSLEIPNCLKYSLEDYFSPTGTDLGFEIDKIRDGSGTYHGFYFYRRHLDRWTVISDRANSMENSTWGEEQKFIGKAVTLLQEYLKLLRCGSGERV